MNFEVLVEERRTITKRKVIAAASQDEAEDVAFQQNWDEWEEYGRDTETHIVSVVEVE